MKKIVLAGGSGFAGSILAKHFHQQVYDVVILSRNPKLYSPFARHVKWNGEEVNSWKEELENAEAVINLSGRTVNCRYNAKNKKEILESRVNATTAIGQAIQQCQHPPKVWMNASSATIYGYSLDKDMPESAPTVAYDFSTTICHEWEKAFYSFSTPQSRKIALRISMILGNHPHSVITVLKRLVRFGLGGKMGNGKQYVSWIHESDFANAVTLLLQRNDLSGPFNLVAPGLITNKDFMRTIRKEMGIPIGIGAMEWMLEIGAMVIRTETELILKSRRAVPEKLLQAGFQFRFPDPTSAIHNLIMKNRHGNH